MHKPGYVRPGLGEKIEVPAADVGLTMQPAANAHVVVNFSKAKRPEAYTIEMEPEGGNVVGSYGGSATLPASNEYDFQNIPGRQIRSFGRPNPGWTDQETDHITVNSAAARQRTLRSWRSQPRPRHLLRISFPALVTRRRYVSVP